jgi:hypothetical protein
MKRFRLTRLFSVIILMCIMSTVNCQTQPGKLLTPGGNWDTLVDRFGGKYLLRDLNTASDSPFDTSSANGILSSAIGYTVSAGYFDLFF